jgi:hypothetical protein
MPVATDSPPTQSEGVLIRSYVAHTDGLKDAAPMRARECRNYSSVEGVATGLKLIGPNPRNYRDWALEGLFNMTDVATGERTHATRMFNRDRNFLPPSMTCSKAEKQPSFRTSSMSRNGR